MLRVYYKCANLNFQEELNFNHKWDLGTIEVTLTRTQAYINLKFKQSSESTCWRRMLRVVKEFQVHTPEIPIRAKSPMGSKDLGFHPKYY